jgi:hypothetical protein
VSSEDVAAFESHTASIVKEKYNTIKSVEFLCKQYGVVKDDFGVFRLLVPYVELLRSSVIRQVKHKRPGLLSIFKPRPVLGQSQSPFRDPLLGPHGPNLPDELKPGGESFRPTLTAVCVADDKNPWAFEEPDDGSCTHSRECATLFKWRLNDPVVFLPCVCNASAAITLRARASTPWATPKAWLAKENVFKRAEPGKSFTFSGVRFTFPPVENGEHNHYGIAQFGLFRHPEDVVKDMPPGKWRRYQAYMDRKGLLDPDALYQAGVKALKRYKHRDQASVPQTVLPNRDSARAYVRKFMSQNRTMNVFVKSEMVKDKELLEGKKGKPRLIFVPEEHIGFASICWTADINGALSNYFNGEQFIQVKYKDGGVLRYHAVLVCGLTPVELVEKLRNIFTKCSHGRARDFATCEATFKGEEMVLLSYFLEKLLNASYTCSGDRISEILDEAFFHYFGGYMQAEMKLVFKQRSGDIIKRFIAVIEAQMGSGEAATSYFTSMMNALTTLLAYVEIKQVGDLFAVILGDDGDDFFPTHQPPCSGDELVSAYLEHGKKVELESQGSVAPEETTFLSARPLETSRGVTLVPVVGRVLHSLFFTHRHLGDEDLAPYFRSKLDSIAVLSAGVPFLDVAVRELREAVGEGKRMEDPDQGWRYNPLKNGDVIPNRGPEVATWFECRYGVSPQVADRAAIDFVKGSLEGRPVDVTVVQHIMSVDGFSL